MESRRLQIPTGMQDTLPGECARKRRLEQEVRRLFALSGYQEVETPILEYYDALDDPTYGYRPEHVWKTFDSRGRAVRLRQGRREDVTDFGDPVELAGRWRKKGAQRLHLVDLEAAFDGKTPTLSAMPAKHGRIGLLWALTRRTVGQPCAAG